MDFGRNLSRAWKHTSRAISKPFTGANKANLKELEKIMLDISRGQKVATMETHKLRFGQYDFTWLTLLTEEELRDMEGEWVGAFQSTVRSSSNAAFAPRATAGTRMVLLNSSDSHFWNALQEVKKSYKKKAEERVDGVFKSLTAWFAKRRKEVDDKIHRNPYLGKYATAVSTVDATFDEARKTGARTDTDRKILAAGGLWRVVKSAISTGTEIAKSVAVPNPKSVLNAVKASANVLNSLGGLIAGVVDMARSREADFRSLSERAGVDQKIAYMKKKYLGSGVIDPGDSLRLQMEQGPQRLEKAAELTAEELNELVEKYRHALWWCDNWEADAKEIEKDIEETDLAKQLRGIFAQATAEGGVVKPSRIKQMDAFVAPDREAMKAQVTELKAQIARFRDFIGPRLRDMEELRAKVDTRRGIAGHQKKTAALGLAYDTKRKIAVEIAGFDRSTLRSHKLDRKGQKPRSKDDSLDGMIRLAMADRRRHIAPEVFEDEDELVFD
ncbi:MAG: hypothetical protein WD766_14230 [Gemmatimonadota bacterium]